MFDAQVVYCSGLDRIEAAGGGNLRFYLYEERNGSREIVLEVVVPSAACPEAIMKTICALAIAGTGVAKAFPLFELLTMQ